MMYPFMTLNDNTEIVHSESLEKDGHEQVEVRIENQSMEVSILLPAGYLTTSGRISKGSQMKKSNTFKII